MTVADFSADATINPPAVFSRRTVLGRAMALGAAGVVGGSLLAACGGDDDETTPTATTGAPAASTVAPTAATSSESAATATTSPSGEAETPSSPAARTGGTFTHAVTGDPTTGDPAVANDSSANQVVLSCYESLVAYKQGTTELEPKLATSWEISDDALTYHFELREGVVFQDGSAFTAEAVQFSFDRMYAMGKGPSFVLTGTYDHAELLSDLEIDIVLVQPSGPFLAGLPKVFIVSPAYVEQGVTSDDPHAETFMNANWGGGTGPFIATSFVPGEQVVYERNPNYWAADERPQVDRVVTLVVPERATARLMLESGDLDHYRPEPDHIAELQANPDVQVVISEALQELYIQCSQVVPPLDDVRVRRAIALAFDYEQFIVGVNNNLATQAQGPIARNILFHDPTVPMLQRNLEEAEQLLAEAGYPDGGFDLEYVHVQADRVQVGAGLILQEGLRKLGIGLTIVELAWAQMVERMQNPDNLMQLYGYYRFPPVADPDAYMYGMWHTSNQINGYNGNMYGTEETDDWMEEARSTDDDERRSELYSLLQHRLFDDVVALFLSNPQSLDVLSARVSNYLYTPTWHQTINLDTIGVSE